MKKLVLKYMYWKMEQAFLEYRMYMDDYIELAKSDNEYGKEKLWSKVNQSSKKWVRISVKTLKLEYKWNKKRGGI